MENYLDLDNKTYNEIQKLIKFVDFISSLKYATQIDRENCKIVKTKIENINNPKTFKDWNICLDIYDPEIQGKINGAVGVYWRTWSVYFENLSLEIEAKSEHSDDIFRHYENHFYFHYNLDFRNADKNHNTILETDIDLFIKDAMNFETYITKSLNEIEIDIFTLP